MRRLQKSVLGIFERFFQDLAFDSNPHTIDSRGFESNAEDWKKRQKSTNPTSAIVSVGDFENSPGFQPRVLSKRHCTPARGARRGSIIKFFSYLTNLELI